MLTLGRTYVTATGRQFKAFHFVIRSDSPELFVHLLEDVELECLPRDHFRRKTEVERLIQERLMVDINTVK